MTDFKWTLHIQTKNDGWYLPFATRIIAEDFAKFMNKHSMVSGIALIKETDNMGALLKPGYDGIKARWGNYDGKR